MAGIKFNGCLKELVETAVFTGIEGEDYLTRELEEIKKKKVRVEHLLIMMSNNQLLKVSRQMFSLLSKIFCPIKKGRFEATSSFITQISMTPGKLNAKIYHRKS